MRTLSIAEVAELLGVREARIREILRAALPRTAGRGRRYAISFQDLVVLKAAKGLLDAKVPAARIRRALAALARDLPPGRPLSGVRIYADGGRVAVYDGDGVWQPETGQTLFSFDVDALARAAEAVRPAAARAGHGAGAEARAAFEGALDLEDADPKAARAAYERALALDPSLGDARVNLGRLLHEAGDAPGAVRLYREALAESADDPVLHYNLALALEDTAGAAAAAAQYERALVLDPEFADAHWNLAGLCEQLGRKADALRHYKAYRDLIEA